VQDCEDLTQEVFLHLLRNGRLVRMEREAADENHLQAMVLKTSKRVMLGHLRLASAAKRGGGTVTVPIDCMAHDHAPHLMSPGYDPSEAAQWHDTAAAVAESEHRLEHEYEQRGSAPLFEVIRECLLVPRLEGGESAQLAARAHMEEGGFRVAVHRARRRFRDLFLEACDEAA
jgi:RNA polymerase sigma-70 factor (ECF subfamily)